MHIEKIKNNVPEQLYKVLVKKGHTVLRPSQIKAIQSGLFERKNLLVCTPTGSGKTLVAELAAITSIYNKIGKAIYIVPLKALATEKYKDFKEKYPDVKIALSIGDVDSSDPYLKDYDLIICTSEKMDSLLRHHIPWLREVATVIIDEVHLLNDTERGPTLEIVLTILRQLLKSAQIIALSATIGNAEELSQWLDANLVVDNWRPVKLHKGIYYNNQIEFSEKNDETFK